MNQYNFNKMFFNNIGICYWTKKSITTGETCYKNKFYGVPTNQCMEFSPNPNICNLNCMFCWRNPDNSKKQNYKFAEITNYLELFIGLRKSKLCGYGSNVKTSCEKLQKSYIPKLFTISYSGEPTLYNNLDNLIFDVKQHGLNVFLVTNGTSPESIINLKNLPDQLYFSLSAYDYKSFRYITNIDSSTLWDNIIKSLNLICQLNCRTVLKIIVIDKFNAEETLKFSTLINESKPNYVEIKGFELVGRSPIFLSWENVPSFKKIISFAKEIIKNTGYKYSDSHQRSKAILLSKDRMTEKNRHLDFFI